MTTGGWILMLVSVGFVTTLLIWCVNRVITTPGETQRLHSDKDIKPKDIED